MSSFKKILLPTLLLLFLTFAVIGCSNKKEYKESIDIGNINMDYKNGDVTTMQAQQIALNETNGGIIKIIGYRNLKNISEYYIKIIKEKKAYIVNINSKNGDILGISTTEVSREDLSENYKGKIILGDKAIELIRDKSGNDKIETMEFVDNSDFPKYISSIINSKQMTTIYLDARNGDLVGINLEKFS